MVSFSFFVRTVLNESQALFEKWSTTLPEYEASVLQFLTFLAFKKAVHNEKHLMALLVIRAKSYAVMSARA